MPSAVLFGVFAATFAMCAQIASLAYAVGRLMARQTRALAKIIEAAPVSLAIGLMGAGALILAQTTDRSLVAALVRGLAAVPALVTRHNPFWMFLAGGRLGFAGLIWAKPQKPTGRNRVRENQAGAADLKLGTRHGR